MNPRAADFRERPFSFADGFVLDYTSKAGLEGATTTAQIVTPSGVQALTTTSVSDGYYLLRGLPPGTHQVKIEAYGHEPLYRTAVIRDPGTDPAQGETVHLKYAALERSAEQVTPIGAAGGTHYASDAGEDGPFLVVPPGALKSEVPIRFTHLRAAETLPELPQDGYYLAFARLELVGLTFQKPATLYLPLQAGIALENGTPIKISYFDARENRWVQDITAGTIVTRPNGKQYLEYEINHFTWIGGQWSPDPVRGCVKYASGGGASGVQTNYGVTNGAGCYSGSTTSSSGGQTLTAYPLTDPGNPVTVSYNGFGDVNFPDIILPDPAPLNIAPPVPNTPCGGGGMAPFSAPTPGLSAQSLTTPLLSSQSTSLSSQSFNTTEKALLVSSSTYGFSSQVFGGAFKDPSTIRVTLDGRDVTGTVQIKPASSTSHILDYTLDKPLKSGLGRRIEVSAAIGDAPRVKGALEADVVAGINVREIVIIPLASDEWKPNAPSPYIVKGLGKIFVFYKATSQTHYFNLNVDVSVVNERGETLSGLNGSRVGLKSSTISADANGTFVDGIANVPITIKVDELNAINDELSVELGGVSPGLLRTASVPCNGSTFTPTYRPTGNPVIDFEAPRPRPVQIPTAVPSFGLRFLGVIGFMLQLGGDSPQLPIVSQPQDPNIPPPVEQDLTPSGLKELGKNLGRVVSETKDGQVTVEVDVEGDMNDTEKAKDNYMSALREFGGKDTTRAPSYPGDQKIEMPSGTVVGSRPAPVSDSKIPSVEVMIYPNGSGFKNGSKIKFKPTR